MLNETTIFYIKTVINYFTSFESITIRGINTSSSEYPACCEING